MHWKSQALVTILFVCTTARASKTFVNFILTLPHNRMNRPQIKHKELREMFGKYAFAFITVRYVDGMNLKFSLFNFVDQATRPFRMFMAHLSVIFY